MLLTVAGIKKEFENNLTVNQLIEVEKVESPLYVTVTVNDEFIKKEEFNTYKLEENDTVEFLYFMGGGSDGIFK